MPKVNFFTQVRREKTICLQLNKCLWILTYVEYSELVKKPEK